MKRIPRATAIRLYPWLPQRSFYVYKKEKIFFPKTVGHFTVTIRAKTVKGHLRTIAEKTTEFVKKMGCRNLIFMRDVNNRWLEQQNDHPPVARAEQWMIDNGLSRDFKRAWSVELDDLPVFLQHFGWIMRCNAGTAYVHFTDPDQQFVGFICQYNSLHLHALTVASKRKIGRVTTGEAWHRIDWNECGSVNTWSGRIANRKIMVD